MYKSPKPGIQFVKITLYLSNKATMANCIFQNRHLSIYFSHLARFSYIVTEVEPTSPSLETERGLMTVWVSGETAEVTGSPHIKARALHALFSLNSHKSPRQVQLLSSHFTMTTLRLTTLAPNHAATNSKLKNLTQIYVVLRPQNY